MQGFGVAFVLQSLAHIRTLVAGSRGTRRDSAGPGVRFGVQLVTLSVGADDGPPNGTINSQPHPRTDPMLATPGGTAAFCPSCLSTQPVPRPEGPT